MGRPPAPRRTVVTRLIDRHIELGLLEEGPRPVTAQLPALSPPSLIKQSPLRAIQRPKVLLIGTARPSPITVAEMSAKRSLVALLQIVGVRCAACVALPRRLIAGRRAF